jgi:hypothetical protein
MALAVLPRREARRLGTPKPTPRINDIPNVRELILTDNRYAEFRQRLV